MHLKRRNSWPPGVSTLDGLNDFTWQRHLAEKNVVLNALHINNNKYYETLTIFECVEK